MNNSKYVRFNRTLMAIITCIALVLVSLVGFFALRSSDAEVAHADITGNWTDEGNYDTSWYVGHESQTEYTLITPAQLAGLAYLVNNGNTFGGKTIKLGADINLAGHYWRPIGKSCTYFDGQGHTISNMTVNATDDCAGLFGYVETGVVKNITLDSSCSVTSTKSQVGGIVGYTYAGVIVNVINNGNVSGTGNYVGGIVGNLGYSSTIKNVTNSGSVTGAGDYVGGIVSCSYDSTIENVTNSGSVTGAGDYVGGIVGSAYTYMGNLLKTATNTGNVEGRHSVGGIVGRTEFNAAIENVKNSGSVSGEGTCVGGIVGNNNCEYWLTIVNGYNAGAITGESNIGGTVGYNIGYESSTLTIVNIYNTGTITGENNIGGIVGDNSGRLTVESVYYLDTAANSAVGSGSITGTATEMTEIHMKGAIDDSESLVNKLNEYVDANPIYANSYALMGWTVSNYNYPTLLGYWTDKDKGNYNTSWYDESETEFTLTTPEQLAGLAYLVNSYNFSDKTIKLGADIDLNGHYWMPIAIRHDSVGASDDFYSYINQLNGNASLCFAGTFDGQGHTIRNMTVRLSVKCIGMFGYVNGGTVKNITLDSNCSVRSTKNYVGGIVGVANHASIENVTNNGSVSGTRDYIGGIVGIASGKSGNISVKNVTNNGSVSGTGDYVGGIVGHINSGTITGAENAGTVIGKYRVGGIIGYSDSENRTVMIENVINSGSVTGTSEGVGGIVGYILRGKMIILNSYNTGTITDEGNNIGGIVGGNCYCNLRILNSYNTGLITGETGIGGIVGGNSDYSSLTIVNSYNASEIKGEGDIGGIVGNNGSHSPLTIINSYYVGAITGESNIGGIIGNNRGTLTVESVYYVDTGISAVGTGSINTGTATAMSEGNMKGAVNDIDSLVYKLNSYVNDNSTYSVDSTDYELKTWGVYKNNYPKLKYTPQTLMGISASYSGGNIVVGNKIDGESIEFNVTYSDGSTGTISADDENVTYWLDGEQIENPEEYVFNKAGQIVVTVKYKGEEFTTLTLNVVDDAPTSSATPSASATPTAIASDGENDEGGLSGGAIAGIVTGSAAILGSGGFGISNLIRRRKRS